MKSFDELLSEKREQNRYRKREVVESPTGVNVVIGGQKTLSFCSNDYLGLANDPAVIHTTKQAIDTWGIGSGAAHLITGHSSVHHALENALAEHTGRERALLFSTGYMANIGVITALCQRGDLVLEDRLNHASLIDGGRYSGATFKRYQHADVESLASYLSTAKEQHRLIVTDGVFSMDGDIAPLAEIVTLAKQYNATVLVDDAHGFGVLGERGGGVCEMLSLNKNDEPVIMGTLGKAFGTFGAFIAGSESLIEWLIQQSRTYVYTTAMPTALAAASLESLRIIREEPQRRIHLQQLIKQFRKGAEQLGLQLMPSQTPIQPVVLGEETKALEWGEKLRSMGLLVKAIRPPTVPSGTSRLRITFSAEHTKENVDQLLNALESMR